MRDWLSAAVTGLVAVAARAAVQPLLGDELPFVVAFPATVLAALMWGVGPGLLTAVMCAAAVAAPWLPPVITGPDRPMQVGAFLIAGVLIALLCGQLGRRHSFDAGPALNGTPETALTAWLRTVLWGAFLVPLTAFVVVAWWGFERTKQDAELKVAHSRDLVYRHAQRSFAIAADIAARADAAASADDETVKAREAEVHQRLSDMAAGLTSVVNLNIWGADGHALARSDSYPVDPRSTAHDRAYFQEQRAQAQALGVSEVIVGRQTGKELMNATIRRSSPDGAFRGVVAVSLSPSFFRDYYQSLGSEEPDVATFTLARTDGEILARWPPTPDGRTHVVKGSLILQRLAEGEREGSFVLSGVPGRETRLVSFKRVEPYPLYVVAGFSRSAMFANWARFVGLIAAIMVPTTAGLVYVSWVALAKTRREQATAIELREQIRGRARAEQSMLESQKLETLAVVTGGIAHDFNNLLAIVSASLHVLRRRHPELAQEKQMAAMSRALQSGVRLTRQLLSFARKQALRPESIDLQEWLPATESLIRSTLGPDIAWQAGVEPETSPIKVDIGELELALINLVVNAKHAMPRGGTLELRAGDVPASKGGERMVAISVADDGVGIAPEILPKVFDPFFTTRGRGAGSGLGLSQVQGFCAQAGGRVRIDSTLGKGTIVTMILPVSDEAIEAPSQPPVEEIEHAQGHILLVEDNEDVGSTTELVLHAAGLSVVRVPNADAALAHLAAAAPPPDAVLSDISMPGSMSGIGLALELRRRLPGLPVLLTTGYAEQLDVATASGFRVLPKPTAPEDLLAELRSAMRAIPAAPMPET